MLEELVLGLTNERSNPFLLWFALGVCVFWYVVKAKDFQPLTLDDLALTWKLHKSQSGCKSSYARQLVAKFGF
jgi:hypothetical protein